MIIIGWIHIISLLIAYIIYLFITIKSFSNKIPYSTLFFTNILYISGFIVGLIWAKIDWGFYFNLDIKNILSVLLFIPFCVENILKTNKPYLPIAGTTLIILNYILPVILYSIHTH